MNAAVDAPPGAVHRAGSSRSDPSRRAASTQVDAEGDAPAFPPAPDPFVPRGDEKAALAAAKRAHWAEFAAYFAEWRHLRTLLGTCVCWFLLDIAFYGINLNQNVVLQQIHFDGSSGDPWTRLFKIATGNLIITALGFVPGYYVTVLTVEYLGRKWIQIQGFLLEALFRKSTLSLGRGEH